MTHVFSRLFVGLSALSWLAVYACSGPNDPPRVLSSALPSVVPDGSAGTGGAMSYDPLCGDVPPTAAGVAPTKGGACTAADTPLCYKSCGPLSTGFKSETCTAGRYAEQSGCSFPLVDYSCYKIPPALDPSCPTSTPQASQSCDVAVCTPCNVGGFYFDSSGNQKTGYCVCSEASDGGTRRWSCASATAWPCPLGQGCT